MTHCHYFAGNLNPSLLKSRSVNSELYLVQLCYGSADRKKFLVRVASVLFLFCIANVTECTLLALAEMRYWYCYSTTDLRCCC